MSTSGRQTPEVADVLIVGGGPAGRSLAAACAAEGLRTTLVERTPDALWTATYGAWVDELPDSLPPACIATVSPAHAIAHTRHDLGRDYAVLDVAALRAHLDAGLVSGEVVVYTGRALGVAAPGVVALADGTRLCGRVLVDAGGQRQPLRPRRRRPASATAARGTQQCAYGLVVPANLVRSIVAPRTALFMDWRPDHGLAGPSTFLYAVPLDAEHTLVEETSLAARPGMEIAWLRERLLARLAAHGITPPPDARVERVRFRLDPPRHHTPGVVGFGAAAPLTHPATGFGLATALALAAPLAAALAGQLRVGGPQAALAAARRQLWSPAAVLVHRFRRIGLEALLRMPDAEVAAFFEVFLSLRQRHVQSYLSGRTDLPGTAATMAALFRAAEPRLRTRLLAPAFARDR